MKKILTLVLLLCFTSLALSAQDDEETLDTLPGLNLVSVQNVGDLMSNLPHFSTLSPNGNLLAYVGGDDPGLCVYNFTDETTTCTPYSSAATAEREVSLTRPTEVKWSPDSRFIALTETSLIYFEDSDIWLYDVENGEYINRTDDGYTGAIFTNEESRGIPIDVLPIWSPDGSLYFFRYVRDGDVDTTQLFTIPAEGGSFGGIVGEGSRQLSDEEPQLVADFSAVVPMPFTFYNTSRGFSLSGAAEISPDGTQLAVLMRPQDPEGYELWIVNLEDGSITQQLPTLDISALGIPEWVENLGFVPEGVTWLNEDEIVMNFINYLYATTISWTAYHIDLETEVTNPIFDFANVPSQSEYFFGTETEDGWVDYPIPQYGAVTPDGEYFLYVTSRISFFGATLEAIPVNGGERLILHRFGDDFRLVPALFTSVGTDGQIVRALIHGYIFTFEVGE